MAARKKGLVLVISGATHSSLGNHPLHFLYSRLDDIDVVVVHPTPEAEWASHCNHRAGYRLKHEAMDLDSFLEASAPSDLMAQYGRIAVIDDVFFGYHAYSDRRLEFMRSSGYVALTQTAELRPEQFTWWELRPDRQRRPENLAAPLRHRRLDQEIIALVAHAAQEQDS